MIESEWVSLLNDLTYLGQINTKSLSIYIKN